MPRRRNTLRDYVSPGTPLETREQGPVTRARARIRASTNRSDVNNTLRVSRERSQNFSDELRSANIQTRRSLRNRDTRERAPLHVSHEKFENPNFVKGRQYGGEMTVVLGVDKPRPSYSKTNRTFTAHLGDNWLDGHMLNEELGGNGKDSRNIIPLTYKGNSSHKNGIETDLKNFLQSSDSEKFGKEIAEDHFFGIRYTVSVEETKESLPRKIRWTAQPGIFRRGEYEPIAPENLSGIKITDPEIYSSTLNADKSGALGNKLEAFQGLFSKFVRQPEGSFENIL